MSGALAGAAAVLSMSRDLTRHFDHGTIDQPGPQSHVLAKRSPGRRSYPRRVVAGVARLVRRIFNYAPVSNAPYQLRLSWTASETLHTGWLSVPESVYDQAVVGEPYRPRTA